MELPDKDVRTVWSAIKKYGNPPFCSEDVIIINTGLFRRQVNRALDTLEASGLLKTKRGIIGIRYVIMESIDENDRLG